MDGVLGRVEAGLGVILDRQALARKRRSVGACTDRGTWVRIEVRSMAKMAAQGQLANGMEAVNLLSGIAEPAWYAALSWQDAESQVLWR